MVEEEKVVTETVEEEMTPAEATNALVVNTKDLDDEALVLINQIIAENDVNKAKDLTYLFNVNQNKKTIVRVDKQSKLLDALTDQLITRVQERPDELSNDDLNKLMKTVADLIDKGQKQVNGANDSAPLIQINQQDNSVNVKDTDAGLNRESRERVKNAVMEILQGIKVINDGEVIDATANDTTEETEED